MSIHPTNGRVYLTDRSPYKDASDHNPLAATVQLDEATTARVATFNVRLKSLDKRSVPWAERRYRAARAIADSGASVVAFQECEATQAPYLRDKVAALTGDPWQMVRPNNVCIMFKSDRWFLLTQRSLLMDNGAEADRRLLMLLLRSKKTGSAFWFGSSHFGVGLPLAIWRRHQAKKYVEQMTNTPRKIGEEHIPEKYFGDIRSISVAMGDFNDYAQHDQPGVRQVFSEGGFYELRVRLSDTDMAGDHWRTNHSFGKLTVGDSRQIDAIFTQR